MKRRALISLLALILSGCWVGDGLYTSADARAVLTPGEYRVTDSEGAIHAARVTILTSGLTRIEGQGDAIEAGFVPLGPAAPDQKSVVWYVGKEAEANERDQMYLLAMRESEEAVQLYYLDCSSRDQEVASSEGAVIEPGAINVCRFPNRESLESAILKIEPSPEQILMRLVRVSGSR